MKNPNLSFFRYAGAQHEQQQRNSWPFFLTTFLKKIRHEAASAYAAASAYVAA